MQQRCTAARITNTDKPGFSENAARFIGEVGRVSVASMAKVDPPTGLRPMAALPNPVEMSYRLAVKGVPVGTDLRTVVVDEDGKPRLCAFATIDAKRLNASLPEQVDDLGSSNKDLPALMPSAPGTGYEQASDAPLEPTKPGVESLRSRIWRVGDYGGARVTAGRHQTPAQAATAAGQVGRSKTSDAIGRFDVPGLPQAVGLRYLAFSWLWIQPSGAGPAIDQVVMRFGNTVVTAAVSNLPPDSNHDLVVKLATEIPALARS